MTKLGESLQLRCDELELIANVHDQNLCADLAKSYKNVNALSYDNTNKKCSFQHCKQSNNIPTTVVRKSNISISVESSFYPRSKY